MVQRRVSMAMPIGSASVHPAAAERFFVSASLRPETTRVGKLPLSSILPHNFNRAWADALCMASAGEVDYFAMLHSDIEPESGWLDVLLDELESTEAAMVSAVVPIKDESGMSSTAYCHPCDPWRYVRFTMSDLSRMPETFGNEECESRLPGSVLLLNSGCWVADLRLPVWRAVDGDEFFFRFEFQTRITNHGGVILPEVLPEDWLWSLRCHAKGLKILATRKVALTHHGDREYRNDRVWGRMRDTQWADFEARVEATQSAQYDTAGCPVGAP